MDKTWKLVLVLSGIFLAGVATGAFATKRFGREWVTHRPGPDQWAPNHLKRLAERLDLKPEQIELIRPIVHRSMEELNRLRAESMAGTRTVFERMEKEISEQLTPEQRTKFEQLNREMRERARKVAPERPGRPGPEGSAPPAGTPPPKPAAGT
jgi:Spy/CpxP family protein refolding chaperone